MDISNATRVADFGSGIGTEGAIIKVDDDNQRLGIGTNNPQTTLQVGTGVSFYGNSGIVSATAFYGDGSNIANAGSSLDASSGLQRVLVTSQTSGNMTAVATNTDLLFNTSTNTLSAANVSIAGTLTYEDVTNIDSLGIVTARTGVKVTAGGINAVGVVTATSFSGDGSTLSGVESGVVNFVASGTIANGATVVINTDGTVGIVTQTGSAANVGTAVVFGNASAYGSSTYDPDSGKVIIAYSDGSNSGYCTAVVGTVSGTSISFGTPVVFESANCDYFSVVYDTTNDKVVICYQDYGNSYYGTAIVGTVSGTSISFGSAVVFESNQVRYVSAAYDSTNSKVVIFYRTQVAPNYSGYGIVGTVSGTSISFGSRTIFLNQYNEHNSAIFDSTNNKMVVAYLNGSNSDYGTAIVGTVSGTSISFGTAVVFETANTTYISCAYDSTNDRVVIAYKDAGNSNYGTAVVGTVSGTDITFGTPVVFESATVNDISATYDSTNGKVVIAYRDNGNSNYGTLIVGTVSGTSITFGDPLIFESASTQYTSSVYDTTNEKVVISYQDEGNSYHGTSVVYSPNTIATNLTAENYIGIAGEAIANAATGKVNVVGGVNSGQSGLTTAQTYYVAPTGILTTTAGTPSVVAGTSISSTKISVR